MPKFNTELFISRRITSSRESGSRGVMVRIAVATTAISLTVMIIAVAVIMGFRSEISGKIAGFGGHLRITALDYSRSVESRPIRINPMLEKDIASMDGIQSVSPYATKSGLLKTEDAIQGVLLKGVTGSYDWSLFRDFLQEGTLPRTDDTVRHKDILISRSLARTLQLGVDDRVEMMFVQEDRPPRRDRFRVSGLYSSGLEEMDRHFILTEIANVQRLNGWDGDRITGYEIFVKEPKRLQEIEKDAYVRALFHDEGDPPLMMRSLYGEYPQLFDWLRTHDVNAVVIITIMIVVALISMVSALLIILLERIRMIGILKTLGMSNRSIRKIFIYRSAYILLAGLLIGNIVGIGLSLVQKYTHAVKLDESGYFLSSVPISLDGWWIAALDIAAFAVIVALLVFPTNIISRITPDKTIRYQ